MSQSIGVSRIDAAALGVAASAYAAEAQPPSDNGTLLVVRNNRSQNFPVGWSPSEVSVFGQYLWVANSIGDGSRSSAVQNSVTMLDTDTGRVATTTVPLPDQIAATAGGAWVLSNSTPLELRFVSDSGVVSPPTQVPGNEPGSVVANGESTWVATGNLTDNSLTVYSVKRVGSGPQLQLSAVAKATGFAPVLAISGSQPVLGFTTTLGTGPSTVEWTPSANGLSVTVPGVLDTLSASQGLVTVTNKEGVFFVFADTGKCLGRATLPPGETAVSSAVSAANVEVVSGAGHLYVGLITP